MIGNKMYTNFAPSSSSTTTKPNEHFGTVCGNQELKGNECN
ncbi:MAG: hypothetical protein QG673_2083 [Pseudomonadota bacterium]|nr:hypothetical protein [Pseudomonadota bacterium]